ncbi:MAG: DUF4386 domain-containing protein [Leifsonia xyli]|nr:MAG: DUF4386 domain-containing protein [Leifsonia xyli]
MTTATPTLTRIRTDRRIARATGGAYLALAVVGMLGFLLVRPTARDSGDGIHLLLALELLVVVSQAAAAIGFYALFRRDRPVEAFAVAVLGMTNATAILASAALITAAARLGVDDDAFPVLFGIADAFWDAGALFFGLWLIPMGSFVLVTSRMPRALGIVLVAGGGGYVLNAFLAIAAPATPAWLGEVMVLPATVGELWMLGYLLIRGIRAPRG